MMLLGTALLFEQEYADAQHVYRQSASMFQRQGHYNKPIYFASIMGLTKALAANPAASYDDLIEAKTVLEAELTRARLSETTEEIGIGETMEEILEKVRRSLRLSFPHRPTA